MNSSRQNRQGSIKRWNLGDWAALWGVGIGLVTALIATRVMTSILYGVSAADWLTFLSVAFLLFAVAMAASYIPARKATQVDPMTALRNE